jgi:hypothetical protein
VPNQDFTAVDAYGFTLASPAFVFVPLLCAPISQVGDVVTVRTTFHGGTAGTGSFKHGAGWCPAGRYVFGGAGYFVGTDGRFKPAAFNNVSNAPSANGTGWTFAGVAPDSGDLLVIVQQCAPKVGRDFLVQTGFLVQPGSSGRVSGYSTCPSGYTPIAGGYHISNPDGSEATPGNVTYSEATNRNASHFDSWFVSGGADVGKKVAALVQCIF